MLTTRAGRLASSAVASSLGASGAIQVLNVMTGVLLARALGPQGRGELAAVLLWPSIFAAIGSLGMVQATTFFTARRKWPVGTVAGSALVVALGQSVILVAVGFAVIPRILHGYSGTVRTLALLFLAFVPLNLVTLLMQSVLNGLRYYRRFQASRVLVVVSAAVPLLTLAATHRLSVTSATIAYLAANAATSATVLLLLPWGTPDARLECRGDLIRELLVFGLKSHTGAVSATLNQRLDQLLISVFLSPIRLGLYVVAVTLSSLGALIGTSVSMVVLPAVSAFKRPDEQLAAVRRYVAATLALCVVVTVPLLVVTGQAVDVFFGAAFAPAVNVCRVLLVASVVLGVSRTLNAALTGLDRPLDAGIAETLALVFTAVGLAVLLPTMGLMGAAVASLVAYSVSTFFMLRRAGRALGVPSFALLVPRRAAADVTLPVVGLEASKLR